MKKLFIILAMICLAVSSGMAQKVKPSEMSPATVAAFKSKLGITAIEGDTLTATDYFVPKTGGTFTGAINAPTAAVGTSTTQVATTEFVQQDPDYYLQTCLDIGITAIAMPMGSALFGSTSGVTLIDGAMYKQYYKVLKFSTLTGFQFVQQTQGIYVADNYNGIKIYSVSGSSLAEVSGGATVDDGNLWKGTAGTTVTKNLPTPISLNPGIYCVAFLWNTSDSSPTAPKLHNFNNVSNLNGTLRLCSYESGKTSMPTSTTAGSGSTNSNVMGLWMY
jgi:hypothetical protein